MWNVVGKMLLMFVLIAKGKYVYLILMQLLKHIMF